MRRSTALVLPFLCAALLGAATPARADTDFGVRAGYYTDAGKPFVGVELLTQAKLIVRSSTEFVIGVGVRFSTPKGRPQAAPSPPHERRRRSYQTRIETSVSPSATCTSSPFACFSAPSSTVVSR